MPVNYTLIQAIEKFHRFLGDDFKVAVPCLGGRELNLKEIATLIAERLVDIYRRDRAGARSRRCRRKPPFASRPALEGPAAVLRILPRRDRTRPGRDAPDRMDRTDRQPGDASLSQGHPAVLAGGLAKPGGCRVRADWSSTGSRPGEITVIMTQIPPYQMPASRQPSRHHFGGGKPWASRSFCWR